MGLIFKVSKKELLTVRKNVFLEKGLPELEKQGFQKAPFKTSWFGWNGGILCYIFQLGRIVDHSIFQSLDIHIHRDDRWIQIYLNIFELSPPIETIEQLKTSNGINFGIPPSSLTTMRLRENGNKGIPLVNAIFSPDYKLGASFSERSFEQKVEKLRKLIASDMREIGVFIAQWHETYKISTTDWDGNRLSI